MKCQRKVNAANSLDDFEAAIHVLIGNMWEYGAARGKSRRPLYLVSRVAANFRIGGDMVNYSSMNHQLGLLFFMIAYAPSA